MTSRAKKQSEIVALRGGSDATLIGPHERDVELDLHSSEWGRNLEPSWEVGRKVRTFHRELNVITNLESRPLEEHVLRFPSAPIYGINRTKDYEIDFTKKRPNLHTLRLLMRPGMAKTPVKRLFILHNGLNETDNLRFFYQLADWILREDGGPAGPDRSACLLAPFPGHLMHFPYAGRFAQLPLSRYLTDAGDLFRHFLRYMVETRWLLSIVNGSSPAPWLVGGEPLPQRNLAGKLLTDWKALRTASINALRDSESKETEEAERPSDDALVGPALNKREVTSSIKALRHLLGRKEDAPPLPVHVVGYSLGGFVAQSVFFAWPNLVTSCATICSGGAIRALSPTAFAHSEEWQSVLHSLRAEIEGSMLASKISRAETEKESRIIGMESDQFGYFHRIFNQVFLQEDQASYKQRLSEHGSRMLFVSGGEDPIVKTRDVLDASPDEGITMLSVARLTHFLGDEAQTDLEDEQRQFWLPEAGGLVARAATRAEELKADELKQARELRQNARSPEEVDAQMPRHRDLASPDFEGALDWLVDGVTSESGWLFVCRNGIPAVFLPPEQWPGQGMALHHHDVAVQNYVLGLARRAKKLETIQERTTLCLSRKLKDVFIGSGELFDPHSDAVGKLVTQDERKDAWLWFVNEWNDQIRWFEAGQVNKRLPNDRSHDGFRQQAASIFARRAAFWQQVPTRHLKISRLPDVWIAVNKEGLFNQEPRHRDTTAIRFAKWVTEIVSEQQSERAKRQSEELKSNQLRKALKEGGVRIVRVSGTELNPRYRGRFESKFEPALLLLAHCAAAVLRSHPGEAPE